MDFTPKEVPAPRKALEPFYAKPNPSFHITLHMSQGTLKSLKDQLVTDEDPR